MRRDTATDAEMARMIRSVGRMKGRKGERVEGWKRIGVKNEGNK